MFFKWLPLKEKATMLSRQSDNITLDFKLLKEELEKSKENVKVVILAKKLNKGIYEKIQYSFHMIIQMYHIFTSRLVIVDGYCILACVVKKRKGQCYIQIWHSLGSIKKIGYQTIGKPNGIDPKTAEIMCLHKNYDYVFCSSPVTAKYYMESFGVSRKQIEYQGLPRIDYIKKNETNIIDEIYEVYPILRDKINVLYAPTFRKNRGMHYENLIENMDKSKYNLIIKTHLLEKTQEIDLSETNNIILDKQFEMLDWLKICNKVITDYSGVSFETAIAGKELYFYLYDYDSYEADVGLNMDFDKEPIGKYVFKDAENLWRKFDDCYDLDALNEFKKKYIISDVDCCRNICSFIEEKNLLGGKRIESTHI